MTYEELEAKRIAYKNRLLTGLFIAIAIVVVVAILGLWQAIPIVAIISFVLVMLLTSKSKKEYSKAYKDYFVLKGLKDIFTNLDYKPEKGMPYETIANTKMMYMGDIYSSNDLISGKYKDINFTQADVHIQEEQTTTDSDGNTTTTYITVFMGRWMIFDFNKTFKSNVQVAQKGFGNNRVQRKGLFSSKKENEYYKEVKMESEEFNKKFKIYAQSEHEAFYLLTPSLMEKIEKLHENNKGRLLLCFINNQLHIGLYDGKDSFEAPSCFKKIDEQTEIDKTNKDILTITQFVDELNLDNDLFRKGV